MSGARIPLVVDTNIVSHALTPNQSNAYELLFKRFEAKYWFIVSGFTQYEQARSSSKLHREKVIAFTESNMFYIDLSKALMRFAARVGYLYSKHTSTVGYKIGDGDIINAALAIIRQAPILTIDSLDYPTPFFKEIDRQRVSYISTRGREVMDTVYVLEPDMDNLAECFETYQV